MDPAAIRERILTEDAFVISEFHKLQTFYKLKSVIRYDLSRDEVIDTESVAEHIYGMHLLATYFVPLEDTDATWDREKITFMIQYHDIDEIETGDINGLYKTDEHIAAGKAALPKVIAQAPESMQATLTSVLDEYEVLASPEAQFVKAIDKLEPTFQLYNENGKKVNQHTQATLTRHYEIKNAYTSRFPCIHRVNKVISEQMAAEGYFMDS